MSGLQRRRGVEYFAPLFALMRELDPQHRPCTLVNCQMLTDAEMEVSLKLADVICLNRYYGWYYCSGDLESAEKELRAELEKWAAYGKPIVFTEFGADYRRRFPRCDAGHVHRGVPGRLL